MTMKNIIIFILILNSCLLQAQGWEKTYLDKNGTTAEAYGFKQTSDGGYILVGRSYDAHEIVAIKTDANGKVQWNKLCGAWYGFDVIESHDNGYIIVGRSNDQFAIVKINSSGDTLWTNYSGNAGFESAAQKIISTQDSCYIVAGYSHNGSDQSYFKLTKVNNNGDILIEKEYGGLTYDICFSIAEANGNYLAAGYTFRNGGGDYYIMKLDANLDTLMTRVYEAPYDERCTDICSTSDSCFVLAGDGYMEGILMKIDYNCNTIWTKYIDEPDSIWGEGIRSIHNTTDNGFIISGSLNTFGAGSLTDAYLVKADSLGNVQWTKKFGKESTQERDYAFAVTQTTDGGYAFAGYTTSFPPNVQAYLVKTDRLGNTISNTITGQVYIDNNSDCISDTNDYPLENWIVFIEPTGQYANTDTNGIFSVIVDSGTYTISQIIPNVLWSQTCPTNYHTITFTQFYDTVANVDFANEPEILCTELDIDISAPFLRKCFSTTHAVSYCNYGTIDATNVYIEIDFGDYIIPESSTIAWTSNYGNVYTFDIGNLSINECGTFYVTDSVSCDALIDQTLCVTAKIYPDTTCIEADSVWDRSSVEVTGWCDGDSLVCFSVKNTGDYGVGDMTDESEIRVFEDNFLIEIHNFQLVGGDSLILCYFANGHTFRLEADQRPGHPGNSHPQESIELCGDSNNPSLGQIILVPENDYNPNIEIDCQEVIASFDPNDKSVKPVGITANKYIHSSDLIEYHINFQNTGNDTAFTVTIRDTISEFLDLATIQSGASSHPYQFSIYGQGILEWVFTNILLPDSTTNEAESHGFIKFSIAQKSNTQNGTLIENRAGIIFDYNEPVITNTVWNIVFDTILISNSINERELSQNILEFNIYPNPAKDNFTIQFRLIKSTDVSINIYNEEGVYISNIYTGRVEEKLNYEINLKTEKLSHGLYYLVLNSNEGSLVRKLIIL